MSRVHITSAFCVRDTDNEEAPLGWCEVTSHHECMRHPEWTLVRDGKVYILLYSRGMGRIFALHDENMDLVSTSPTTSVLFSDADGNEM
jgi:hypothetical protein